jgi:hypothetical protein
MVGHHFPERYSAFQGNIISEIILKFLSQDFGIELFGSFYILDEQNDGVKAWFQGYSELIPTLNA